MEVLNFIKTSKNIILISYLLCSINHHSNFQELSSKSKDNNLKKKKINDLLNFKTLEKQFFHLFLVTLLGIRH